MIKKTALLLVCALVVTLSSPAQGLAWRYHHPRSHHHNHDYHGDASLFWGLTGLLLGTAVIASIIQQPPPVQIVRPRPRPIVYTYPPPVPPGLCRWERYLLDGNGRIILDQYGQPVMEYTIGSCQYPPE